MAGDMSENQKENIKQNLRKKKEYILTSKSKWCVLDTIIFSFLSICLESDLWHKLS